MGRSVRCYNAYFGDCYAITDDEDKLVVDFGVWKSSKILDGITVDDQLENITNNLITHYSNSEMLITHFHYDHICGFVRMVDMSRGRRIFNKIYIPNVWGFPKVVATNLMESIIASFLYDNEKLVTYSAGNISLLELINHLVKSGVRNVYNLKRGDKFFKEKYITLLPDDDILSKINDEYKDIRSQLEKLINDIFSSIESDEENRTNPISGYLDDLEEFAEQIAQIFDSESINLEENQDAIENIYNNYSAFEQEFLNYLAGINTKEFLDALGKILKRLNKRGNRISIVFQNIDDNENILFTGDAERADLRRLLDDDANSQEELKFKVEYKYLKLPHHGTEPHYVDFTRYHITANNVLIPNAKVKGQQWVIAEQYGSFGETKYCSVANNCDCMLSCNNLVGCTSIRNTIYPELYLDV